MVFDVSEAMVGVVGPTINVTTDVSESVKVLRFLKGYGEDQIIEGLADAIKKSVMYVRGVWTRNASGNQVAFDGQTFKVNRITGQYVRSIEEGMIYPVGGDPYWGKIESRCPYAIEIEMGRRAMSGPEVRAMMLRSPKAKTAKDGSRYITIPFRHGTPGTTTMKPMPPEIYEGAKGLSRSKPGRVGGSLRMMYTTKQGHQVNPMQFGRRSVLTSTERPFAPYTWKAGQYAGMTKRGKAGHTQYMTFRRVSSKMSSNSQAWARPAVPPRPVAQASARQSVTHVLELIRDGLISEVRS